MQTNHKSLDDLAHWKKAAGNDEWSLIKLLNSNKTPKDWNWSLKTCSKTEYKTKLPGFEKLKG